MASPTISKAVAGIQSVIVHFQTVAAAVANRARFRLPQKSKIVRIGASYRESNATDLVIMVEAGGVNLLSAGLDMKTLADPTPPVAVDRNVGGGINLGAHSWVTTFLNALGESAGSAKSNVLTLAAPTAPTGAENQVAGSVELGTHSYKVTAVNADGESVISAKSNVVTLAAPTTPVAALAGAGAGNVTNGDHSWKVTFVNAGGESVASAKSNVLNVADNGVNGQVDVTIPTGPAGTTARRVYRTVTGDGGDHLLVAEVANNVDVTYRDNIADGALGAAAPADTGSRIAVSAIPVGPAGTTARKLYRSAAGDAGPWLLLTTIADNVTVVFADNVADGALGAAAPAATGGSATVTIPTGPAGTTSRKVYRTDAGDAGDHKLVATVANNTTTSITDTLADGAGAAAPTVDTRQIGEFFEGTLAAAADEVAKEAEITVDVDTLTGTNVLDLCVQIDLVRLD